MRLQWLCTCAGSSTRRLDFVWYSRGVGSVTGQGTNLTYKARCTRCKFPCGIACGEPCRLPCGLPCWLRSEKMTSMLAAVRAGVRNFEDRIGAIFRKASQKQEKCHVILEGGERASSVPSRELQTNNSEPVSQHDSPLHMKPSQHRGPLGSTQRSLRRTYPQAIPQRNLHRVRWAFTFACFVYLDPLGKTSGLTRLRQERRERSFQSCWALPFTLRKP